MSVHDCKSSVSIWRLNHNRLAIDHYDSKQRNSTTNDRDASRDPSYRSR